LENWGRTYFRRILELVFIEPIDMTFDKPKQKVANRGRAPDTFLEELVSWGKVAPSEIFAKNEKYDVYSSVVSVLGPWEDEVHRRAVMLEVLRVLGGFESSWNWQAGVDTTNPNSNTPCTEEAGIFQCSGDSMTYHPSLKQFLVSKAPDASCDAFRKITKEDHLFAFEYCARLLRITTKHHGPIKHGHIHEWLRRDSVAEFRELLSN
jgi:hypothetical protein